MLPSPCDSGPPHPVCSCSLVVWSLRSARSLFGLVLPQGHKDDQLLEVLCTKAQGMIESFTPTEVTTLLESLVQLGYTDKEVFDAVQRSVQVRL